MQLSAILALALAATGLAMPAGPQGSGASNAAPKTACKRGELSARCFGGYAMTCTGNGRYFDMSAVVGQDAHQPLIDCKQIAECSSRGSVTWKGHASNAFPASVIGICQQNCACEAA